MSADTRTTDATKKPSINRNKIRIKWLLRYNFLLSSNRSDGGGGGVMVGGGGVRLTNAIDRYVDGIYYSRYCTGTLTYTHLHSYIQQSSTQTRTHTWTRSDQHDQRPPPHSKFRATKMMLFHLAKSLPLDNAPHHSIPHPHTMQTYCFVHVLCVCVSLVLIVFDRLNNGGIISLELERERDDTFSSARKQLNKQSK